MNRRLSGKLLLVLAAVGAMTLLQGCGQDDEDFVIGTAWAPVGSVPLTEFGMGLITGSTATPSQGGAATGGTQ